ncbi:MAG: DUF4350 domain-containing protein, partial [Actinomycetota bacterium]
AGAAGARGGGMKRRGWIALAALAILAVVAVVIAGPGASPDAGPTGTLALMRFLPKMGIRVRTAGRHPDSGIFVLFSDLRTGDQDAGLLDWVRDGGTLVVADPQSQVLAEAGIDTPDLIGLGSTLKPGCVAPETAGVSKLTVEGTDSVLSPGGAGAIGCFPKSGGFFEVSYPMGSGRLIALGGDSPFTNAHLYQAGNATFAVDLFGGGGTSGATVTFGDAVPPGTAPASLWGTLPAVARIVIIQIVIAAVAYALVRARRFGKPALEYLPAPVPASELVDAVGRLYRSSRATAFAGDQMRGFTLRRLQSLTGSGGAFAPIDPEALSSTLAGLSGRDLESVRRLVAGPPPGSDEELIALGRELEELRQRVEGSWA